MLQLAVGEQQRHRAHREQQHEGDRAAGAAQLQQLGAEHQPCDQRAELEGPARVKAVLKRRYGLDRSRLKGDEGRQIWTEWAILAYNLDTVTVRER